MRLGSNLLAKVAVEFKRSPIAFIAGVVAVIDVIFKIFSAGVFGNIIEYSKLGISTFPPDKYGFWMVILLCYILLSQNVLAFVWYKAISLSSGRHAIYMPIYCITFIVIAWLTD